MRIDLKVFSMYKLISRNKAGGGGGGGGGGGIVEVEFCCTKNKNVILNYDNYKKKIQK